MTNVAVENGTYLITGTNTPFGATAVLNFNGGNFAQTNTTANQTFATTGLSTYGGGGHFTLTSAASFSSQFTVGNFIRQGVGTLVVTPVTNTLGSAGAGGVRLVATTAPTITNGIVAPNIISEIGGVGGFVTHGVNGLAPSVGGTVPALTGAQTTAIFNGAGVAGPLGDNSIYAIRTSGNITGPGTIKVSSVSSTNEGAILVNATAGLSANVIFDPTAASGGSAASGEGLIAAVFDLNGFNQQIGPLTSPALTATAVSPGGAAGYVTNSATTIVTLKLNSATKATYGGVIQGNVGLTQQGPNVQTLANVNTYVGPTVITPAPSRCP